MKYKKACIAIFLLIFFITPLSIGKDTEYDFTFVRLKYNGSYRYEVPSII